MSMSPGGDRHAAQIFGFDTPEEAQTKQFNDMNPGLSAARQTLLTKATSLADRPYQAYTGERVAGLSDNENMGLEKARSGYGDSRAYFDKAGQTIDSVAGSNWDDKARSQFMDPYVGGVVDTALRKENTAYQQDQNALRLKSASVGAFGGDREALLETSGQQKHLQTVGDITSKGYSDAYNTAFANWQSDKTMKLNAARDYESVGGDLSRLNSDQIQNLMQTGNADRVVRQLGNDAQYSAFIEKRDWDVNNLQPLIASISAVGGGTPSRANAPSSNGAADALGMVSAIAGYFGKNKKTTNTSTAQQDENAYGPMTDYSQGGGSDYGGGSYYGGGEE